jgi:hypothetical protein
MDTETKESRIGLRLPTDLLDLLHNEADRQNSSLSETVRHILTSHFNANGASNA